MRIMCCCSQLRSKATPAGNGQPPGNLPASPPAARLPPLDATDLALSLPSTPDRSSLTDPLPGAADDALAQPGVLVIDESDDEDGEQAADESNEPKPLGALEAVKARIRRHLSQGTLSRQSETREQIAHRTEVKRLMRKRIRDELQTESNEIVAEPSTPPRLTSPIATPLSNGPRDTIEFTVEGNAERAPAVTKVLCHSLGSAGGDDYGPLRSVVHGTTSTQSMEKDERLAMARPMSLQYLSKSVLATLPVKHVHGHLRQRSSLPEIPASPVLSPVPASSANDASSLVSWRLSLEADRLLDILSLGDRARQPSQALLYASPSRSSGNINATLTRHSGHLRSNSLPSTLHGSAPMKGLNSSQVSLASSHHTQIPPSMSLIRAESPVGLWLRTQTQQFRISTLSQLPSNQLSEPATAADMVADFDEAAISIRSTSSRTCRRVFLGHHNKPKLLDLNGGGDNQGNQDNNCEAHDAMQPTPRSSSSHSAVATASVKHKVKPTMHDIVKKGLTGLKATFFRGNESCHPVDSNIKMTSIPSIILEPGISMSDLTKPGIHKLLVDSESDASSFHRRDAELRDVEERFRHSHLRQVARVPVESKFHEAFQEQTDAGAQESLAPPINSIPQLSIDMKIYHLDGNGPEVSQNHAHAEHKSCRNHLEVPTSHHVINNLRANDASFNNFDKSGNSYRRRGFSSSKDGDETAEMWKRAIEADSAARSCRRSSSYHNTAAHTEVRQFDDSGPVQVDAYQTQTTPSSRHHSPTSNVTITQEDEDVFRRSLEKSNKVLEDWAWQFSNPGPVLMQGESSLLSPCRPFNTTSNTPPASWCGFPSESREARNAMAGESDLVISRDFAIVGLSPSGQTIWITDKEGAEPKLRMNTRSISDKLTQPFQKFRLSRLWVGRTHTPPKDKSTRGARRSSIRTSGNLEYPELEILPNVGGYEELRVIKRELNEMRGLSTSAQSITSSRAVRLTGARSTKTTIPSISQHDGFLENEVSKAPGVIVYRGVDASNVMSSPCRNNAPEVNAANFVDPGITDCSSSSSQPFHSINSSSSSWRTLTPKSVLRHGPAKSISNLTISGGYPGYGSIPSSQSASNVQGPRSGSYTRGHKIRPSSNQSSPY